jgi:1,4-alpha-glucan branching enzyme
LLDPQDLYLFAEGTHERAWRFLGAHRRVVGGEPGVLFAVWAPNAGRVAVVGDFNGWNPEAHPLGTHGGSGIWERFVPGVAEGALYKFALWNREGSLLPLKADPYARAMEPPGRTASVVAPECGYAWQDEAWMRGRGAHNRREAPIAIYEVHLGSWRRHLDGNRYLGYRELAEQLVRYVRDLGFTHLQLLPVSEHPFDGSWGYQPLGLFAPSCRFGSADDFRHLVDRCHAAGLGVLLDWVPAHFPTDPHGLARFDGTALYEHEDPRRGFHLDWHTLIYNLGRHEVASFLISNAHYWLEEFHVDGLRVDAVASMLYLDYSRKPGEWLPNVHGGNENLEAVALLREVNRRLYANFPDAMTVAEESTAWPGVSQPVHHGGLGFGFKWNMGWMHDTLRYMARDPAHRRFHHNELTFALMYAFSENYVLPLSHDEVVHGKRSLLGRMPGDEWQRFANLRAFYAYLWTHPGKKLLFMGGEFAQRVEWNHDRGLDWQLLDDPRHAGVQRLVRDLNTLYREQPALHALDCDPAGFAWVDCHDAERSVLLFRRRAGDGAPEVVVACNFTPVPRHAYRIGLPADGFWRERLNTDAALYGGADLGNAGGLRSEPVPAHGQAQSILATLPPLATLVFVQDAAPA